MGLKNLLKKKIFSESPPGEDGNRDRGRTLLLFENTTEVIQAENLLKSLGFDVKVVGPPPEVRTGCDLAIEFSGIEELAVLRSLEEIGLPPLKIILVSGARLEPVSLYQVKDFGQYLMVRAANMKLTIDKESEIIVNVSGGGCPDVPYIAAELVGKPLGTVQSPRQIGHTLCGYALHLAYEEMKRRC